MAYNYKSESNEHDDDGYSIPKIIVAVLILVLIGTGGYIYYQQRKLDTSISYLLNSKKEAEVDLNEMIEKYNLAIEDNEYLEDDLIDERDQIIKFRDSIKNIKKADLKENTSLLKTISNLKKESSISLVNKNQGDNLSNSNLNANNTTSGNSTNIEYQITNKKKTLTLEEKSDSAKVAAKNDSATSNVKKEITAPKKNTTFRRVEIPPTYPGCVGTSVKKKLCFEKKIKRHLSRKFNTTIIDYLELSSGKKKIWINFDINKNGNIANITARAPDDLTSKAKKKLEAEAVRIIKKLPKMIPAKQNGENVSINYSVPLTVVVQ